MVLEHGRNSYPHLQKLAEELFNPESHPRQMEGLWWSQTQTTAWMSSLTQLTWASVLVQTQKQQPLHVQGTQGI